MSGGNAQAGNLLCVHDLWLNTLLAKTRAMPRSPSVVWRETVEGTEAPKRSDYEPVKLLGSRGAEEKTWLRRGGWRDLWGGVSSAGPSADGSSENLQGDLPPNQCCGAGEM